MQASNAPRTGEQFEQQIGAILDQRFPHCCLAAVPVFRSDAAMVPEEMANELDFILHLKHGDRHTLLIIECKASRVTGKDNRGNFGPLTANSDWIAHYRNGVTKSVKNQLRAQRQALLTNLEPIDGIVRVHAVVVAFQPEGVDANRGFLTSEELTSFELSLVRSDRFEEYLGKLLTGGVPLRVQQSEILRRIRLGQPVAALGHPEIYNAIEYTHRCRAFIDSEIFRHLDFKAERWAINGSAGMGKSVLLIYGTMVLITDKFIACLRDGSRYLQNFNEDAAKYGITPLDKRRVWVVAHTEKQREMLERMFDRFIELYSDVDPYNEFRRVKPEFHVFSEIGDIDCNVLLVDEAHDLGAEGEKRVREWHQAAPGNYLVIACDRHQKLRLSNDATRMIEGINFSRCTKKLTRNYRNPFPAYAGSLGLLFRWFTSSGPKILPKVEELQESFGFGEVRPERAGVLLLRARNDAHPANNWSHLVSNFPLAKDAYRQLSEFPLRKEQVLWIRFTPEESGFNYENLHRWSYHNVYGADAPDLLDKYVKGQEFPVVVIEGIPEMFSWTNASKRFPNDVVQARIEMWQARRLVYLAASRANVFLYFILAQNTPADVTQEFETMFQQLARQEEQSSPSGTVWDLRVSTLGETETLDAYLDAIEAEHEAAQTTQLPAPQVVPITSPETILTEDATGVELIAPQPAIEDSGDASNVVAHQSHQEPPPPAVAKSLPVMLASVPVVPLPVVVSVNPASVMEITTAKAHDEVVTVPSVQVPAQLGEQAPVINTASAIKQLGQTATLNDVAQALGRPVLELKTKLSSVGLVVATPTSKVNVEFVVNLMKKQYPAVASPEIALQRSVASPLPRAASKSAAPVSQVESAAHQKSIPNSPPQTAPAKEDQLSELVAQLKLPRALIVKLIEAEGCVISGKNPTVPAEMVNNLLKKLAGIHGIKLMRQVASSHITVKALANHLGLRPHVVIRDLMSDQLLLTQNSAVPFEQIVRLCHYYKRPLPPAGQSLNKRP